MGQIWSSAIITSVVSAVAKVLNFIVNKSKSLFFVITCSKIQIGSHRSPKGYHAVLHEIESLISPTKLTIMQDGYMEPSFHLDYGTYRVRIKGIGGIFVDYQKEHIHLYIPHHIELQRKDRLFFRIGSRSATIKDYITKVYKERCSPDELMTIRTSNGDKWGLPIYRRPTQFREDDLTAEMKVALQMIDRFRQGEKRYHRRGIPYRYGIMLWGVPGSGKTTITQIVGKKYNMTLYLIDLNSPDMTDTILLNLIASVPCNSCIVMEEVDRQVRGILENPRRNVTIGGLLSALDGPQRLSHGSIIIMTAHSLDFVRDTDYTAMFRKGRIDDIVEFQTPVSMNIDEVSSDETTSEDRLNM